MYAKILKNEVKKNLLKIFTQRYNLKVYTQANIYIYIKEKKKKVTEFHLFLQAS